MSLRNVPFGQGARKPSRVGFQSALSRVSTVRPAIEAIMMSRKNSAIPSGMT
jgi:hypothetical protein